MGAVLQLFRDLGPTRLAAIAAVTIAFIIGFIALSMRISSPPLSTLYNNLDLKESGQIVASLEAKHIPYEIRANGTQILIPEDKVLRLRMSLAQEGLPSKGSIVGYEIFDQAETLGTSNFVQNVNLIRALEGELGRTISSFAHVESARVHLVVPKRELFSRDRQEPSASVVLKMKGSNSLSKEEVKAIGHLVATGVPGLDVSKITIVDTAGKPFKLGAQKEDDPGSIAATTEEFRINYQNHLEGTIEALLEKSLGAGHVKAEVSADINFDRQVTNSELYDPNGQVVRSVQTVEEKEASTDKNQETNVSAANNLPNAGGAQGGGNQSNSNSSRVDETTNYEISKTVKNHVSETGTVKRLSIAVLVDGIYTTDQKTKEVTYAPRSDAELKKLEALVKSAVGFDATRNDKVEVINMQFFTDLEKLKADGPLEWLKRELHGIIQTLIVGIVVILVILLVVRPLVSRAFELTKTDMEETELQNALMASAAGKPDIPDLPQEEEAEGMIDIEHMAVRVKSSSVKSINDVVSRYPEETMTIIRAWLNKE